MEKRIVNLMAVNRALQKEILNLIKENDELKSSVEALEAEVNSLYEDLAGASL